MEKGSFYTTKIEKFLISVYPVGLFLTKKNAAILNNGVLKTIL
jgi:hypothetical protein